jgi:hypothetical protein
MNRIFIATLVAGMILNVAAVSAQGYPFPACSTDQPWSVNQRPSAEQLGSVDTTSDPRTVNQDNVPHPNQDGPGQFQISRVGLEQSGHAPR